MAIERKECGTVLVVYFRFLGIKKRKEKCISTLDIYGKIPSTVFEKLLYHKGCLTGA